MFVDFALLCPGALFTAWAITLLLHKKKSITQNIFTLILVVCAILFIADGVYLSPHADIPHISTITAIRQISGPIILPALAIFIRLLCGKKPANWVTAVWFVLVLAQSVAIVLFMVLMGDNSDEFIQALRTNQGLEQFSGAIFSYYKMICVDWYNILLLLQILYIALSAIILYVRCHFTLREIVDVWQGNSARIFALVAPALTLLMMICGAMRVMGDRFLIDHPLLTALLMLALTILAHITCYSFNQKRLDPNEFSMDDTLQKSESLSSAPAPEATSTKNESLKQKFDKIMEHDRLYLYATINLDIVSKKLGTNRSYLSKVVSQNYNMTFSEYINHKRIEYAQELMLNKPHALLDYIASQSGYLSTTAFSRNFQQQVGLPPRLWIMNQLYKNKTSQSNKQ